MVLRREDLDDPGRVPAKPGSGPGRGVWGAEPPQSGDPRGLCPLKGRVRKPGYAIKFYPPHTEIDPAAIMEWLRRADSDRLFSAQSEPHLCRPKGRYAS